MTSAKQLEGVQTWVCGKGHCPTDGEYMNMDGGEVMECPLKEMFDQEGLGGYLELPPIPEDGKCPYYFDGFTAAKEGQPDAAD